MMPLTADITDLAGEVERQLLLDVEVPVLVVAVLAVTVDRLRREELELRHKEWSDRVGESRNVRVCDSVAGHRALHRIAEVVVLVRAIVYTEAGAEDGGLVAEDFP